MENRTSIPGERDPQTGFRVLDREGNPFRGLRLWTNWLLRDRIRGSIETPQGARFDFEAILPGSPLSVEKVLSSAAARATRVAHAGSLSRRMPSPTATSPLSTLARIVRRVFKGAPRWRLAELTSDPFLSGPATVSDISCHTSEQMADPFCVRWRNQDWIFYESIDERNLGKLRVSSLGAGSCSPPSESLLDLPHHLSYPNVFEFRGELHMIPETGSASEVSLWKCTGFPGEWTKVHTLLQGETFHDATLLRHGDRWWLFVCVAGSYHGDHSSELRLYHSPDLVGSPFVPHPRNPISLSVEGARPAGNFFEHEGKLIRPAQDCRNGYGRGVILFQVDQLDEREYRESRRSTISPPPKAAGLHTLNRSPDGRWIVDVLE